MSTYQAQVRCAAADIDPAFWRQPRGVQVPDDDLRFLLVPDAVESLAVAALAQQVQAYQRTAEHPVTCALMATMGGMLPGILLHDHLAHGLEPGAPDIAFGTIGVSLYKGPDERHAEPRVTQAVSVDILKQTVLVIDDLGDRGGTLKFLTSHLQQAGAARVLSLVVYMKPQAMQVSPADFYFGEVAQDTWIITPRETVETLRKRVPVWVSRGADERECRRRLVELIGYPPWLVERYLPHVFALAQADSR
ncbi:MAG: phosphoribosyltransferase family protein [Halioglobus sp.]